MKILRPEELTTFPDIRELSPEELAQAHRLAKAAFSADDLQRYTEDEEGVSMEEVLKELEAIQREHDERSS